MGQTDVYDWLKEKKKLSNDWFTIKQIQEGLKDKGFTNGVRIGVWSDLMKLASFGMIKVRGIGLWDHKKEFQAK